jgi:DNA mismatch repair protein MutH
VDFNEYYSPDKYDPYSVASIFNYAKDLTGHTLADKCHSDILEKNYAGKGNFGQYLEKYYFGFNLNNNPAPDFSYVDVELKSGGIIETAKGFRAKERLAIGKINFFNIVNESFETSHIWTKLKLPLLVFHIYKKNEDPRNYKINNVNIISFTKSEIAQLIDDWSLIKNKVINGKAHEISGGDTLFLEAATTGGKNQKPDPQPYSEEPAHPRRFALKPAFVTTLLKKEEFSLKEITQSEEEFSLKEVVQSEEERPKGSIVSPQVFLLEKLKEFKNISLDEAVSLLGIKKSTQKNFISTVSKKLVEKILLDEYSENIFESLELIHKTCRVYDGKLKEHISFPYIRYDKLVQQEWEESDFNQIIESKFMFVFWENINNEFYLRKITFWNAPPKEVIEAKRIWEKTKLLILDKQADNLPKTTESYFVHIRPHGRDSNDRYPTHYGVDVKKQSFWIHKNYIEENILKNE